MAEEVVLSGVQKLYDLLSREYARLQGVGAQVYALKHQLEMLQSLLKDADTKKHESDRVRNFLEEVKDGVYDAEDIIESFLLNEIGGEEIGIIKKLVNLLASCFLLHKLALDIEDVTKRISMVIGDMQSLGTQRVMDAGPSLSFQDRQRKQKEIQQTFPNSPDNGSDLVGVEESVVELVGHLVKNDIIQVVSISGMGGIGKTTLARQVFHHDLVRRHFDGFAWVCVSQQFTQKHVWQKILQQLQPHNGEILQMDVHALQSKLHQLLGTAKYLVFLDDVWTGEDWDRIKAVFPQKKGWKMLLTSRNEGVRLHVDRTCLGFRASILKTEESWKLFEMVVSSKRYDTELPLFDKEMEVMGKEMVAYCGGLPLAVIQLGVLLTKKHTAREWKRVYENIGFEISQTSVYKVLSLSYEDLPMHLKSCFLCLAHFPKDYKIELSTLFNYWAAEGIYNRSTIHDRGEDYLEELVRRNLVIVNENYWKSRFESCQMHDMMREVCLSKAKEDNFLQVIQVPNSTCTINAHSPCRSRRLTIHSGNAFDILVQEKRKVRSLFVLRLKEAIWIHQASSFQSLPMLRVLDLSLVIFEGETLPNSIGRLIYLRFLSLDQATVLHIPSTLGNLKLLLYLNLNVNARLPVYVPNVFKEMIELRYLALPRLMVDKTKLEFGDLVNMEYLSSFSTQHSNVRDLLCMTKLRSLTVSFSERCTFATLSPVLRDLQNLTTLEFNLMIKSIKVDYVEEFVLDCMYLKELGLAVRMSKIPDQHQFPPNLGHIYLSFCHMEEDPMPILEKFRHLKSVDLRGEVFVGRKMVCSKGGFPQLCALKISKESELEEWIVEEGSMPCLLTLTIHDCKKLKELPKGLKYIISLKEVKIEGMKEWKEKLILGGKDYYKVQHIPSVLLINCDDE